MSGGELARRPDVEHERLRRLAGVEVGGGDGHGGVLLERVGKVRAARVHGRVGRTAGEAGARRAEAAV
ncbi:hypothetical protein Sdia_39060 [Streptomyces diastaticus subsp. diastaticus]|uniref:Uncharacterized protein n=1 Tax=Streptomyces diastaticus subsp. diastaticus TaxID=68040 RepID=A0ABQ1CSF7_STRDI|nr:hypothetical protein Sdia_39060 [Streptomyces diastaticus subsp. diastaticus]